MANIAVSCKYCGKEDKIEECFTWLYYVCSDCDNEMASILKEARNHNIELIIENQAEEKRMEKKYGL